MAEANREIFELKREIIEARNQAIKTDNQVRNLTLDIKGFEQRFDALDGRVRLSSFGVNLMIAATIALAAYVVSSVRLKSYESELHAVRAASGEQLLAAQHQIEDVSKKLAEADKKRRTYEQASKIASRIVDLLDDKQDSQAGQLLDTLHADELSTLERRLLEKRFVELRRREADSAYRAGRQAALGQRFEAALPQLRRALRLDPEARTATTTRFLLATSLYSVKQYSEAEPLLRALLKTEDKSTAEEAQYYSAATLARLGKPAEAKEQFARIAAANGRFAGSAKVYMNALETHGELPLDLSGGRVRFSNNSPIKNAQ